MVLSLRIFLLICILAYCSVLFYMVRKKNLNIKYTLLWIFSALFMLIIVAFPSIMSCFSKAVGIISLVNAVFTVAGMITLLILLSITLIVSQLNNQIRDLTQATGLMEERIRILEQELSKNKSRAESEKPNSQDSESTN